jgi:xanthine dehydrogenase accessory factor
VVDDRAAFASAERFPLARRVIAAPTFKEGFAGLRLAPSTYCVVVTRGHSMDLECTALALAGPSAYVGLIGSRVKVRALLGRLRDAGRLEGVDLARLHAPIGVDVGGGTHGEIAVSIVAELVAHRRGRLTGLRTKRMPVEEMQSLAARAPREARE